MRTMSGSSRHETFRIVRCSMGDISLLEPLRQRFALSCQDPEIAAHGDERAPALEPLARVGLDRRENARDLAGALNSRDGIFRRAPRLRVRVVADMAERGGQVAGSDEQ